MKKTIIATLLFTLIAAGALLAQMGPMHHDPAQMMQHRVKYLTTVLSLTAAQQQQATTIFTNAANSASSLHPQMKSAHEALHTAVQSNDTAAIDSAASQAGSLMGQMMAIHAKAEAAFFQILTPDQQNKLKELDQQDMHGHGMGMEAPGPGAR